MYMYIGFGKPLSKKKYLIIKGQFILYEKWNQIVFFFIDTESNINYKGIRIFLLFEKIADELKI